MDLFPFQLAWAFLSLYAMFCVVGGAGFWDLDLDGAATSETSATC